MIAIKKYFFQMTAYLLLIIPIVCWADYGIGDAEDTETVGGTIPVIQKFFVTGDGYSDLFSSITPEDFDAGFKETNEGKVILTVLSNTAWKLSVKGGFRPVGDYVKPASDLLVKIKNKTVIDEAPGSGGAFNKSFADFGPLSNEEQVLWMNEGTGDYCQAVVDYKVLLCPAKDIPGKYLATVTYTISAP